MKQKIAQTILYLLEACLLALFVYFSYGGSPKIYLVCIVSFLLGQALIPVLHEVGHLVFGRAVGMRLQTVTLFCFRLEKKDRLTVRIVSPFSETTAGECRMTSLKEEQKNSFILFSAGGVVFTLVYLTAGLLLCFLLQERLLWATLGMTLPYCFYLTVLNSLPFSSEQGQFDGAVFWGLLKNDPSMLTFLNIYRAQGAVEGGMSPSKVKKELFFSLPQLPEDDENFALLQYWRYLYFLDKEDVEQAVKAITRLESCLEYVPDYALNEIYNELAYVYAAVKKDELFAERYIALAEKGKNTVSLRRAKIAYATLKGNKNLQELYLKEECPAAVAGLQSLEERLLKELLQK